MSTIVIQRRKRDTDPQYFQSYGFGEKAGSIWIPRGVSVIVDGVERRGPIEIILTSQKDLVVIELGSQDQINGILDLDIESLKSCGWQFTPEEEGHWRRSREFEAK